MHFKFDSFINEPNRAQVEPNRARVEPNRAQAKPNFKNY